MKALFANWVYGGFLAGILLLSLLPLLAREWSLALTLVFLQLPIYMLHQFEEHDGDRFRAFTNGLLGDGRVVLSKAAVFIINIPGIWGINVVSILLAGFVDIGFGLIGIYLTLVNALAHIGQAARLRRSNPGLVTSIVLFVPAGGFALAAVIATGHATPAAHIIGLGSAIGIHALIIAWVLRQRKVGPPIGAEN